MSESIRAANTPYAVLVDSAKTYFRHSCGQSKKHPFCAGSQSSAEFTLVTIIDCPGVL